MLPGMAAEAVSATPSQVRVPGFYWWWLSAITVSTLGAPVGGLVVAAAGLAGAAALNSVSFAVNLPLLIGTRRRFLAREPDRAPGIALSVGVLLAGAGAGVLAVAGSPVLAAAATALTELGLGIFGTHVSPLVLAATPGAYLSRVQAVLTLCQTLPWSSG